MKALTKSYTFSDPNFKRADFNDFQERRIQSKAAVILQLGNSPYFRWIKRIFEGTLKLSYCSFRIILHKYQLSTKKKRKNRWYKFVDLLISRCDLLFANWTSGRHHPVIRHSCHIKILSCLMDIWAKCHEVKIMDVNSSIASQTAFY